MWIGIEPKCGSARTAKSARIPTNTEEQEAETTRGTESELRRNKETGEEKEGESRMTM